LSEPRIERVIDPRLMAAIVASALFMQNMDSAAIVTALPAMAIDLGEPPARLGVAITSYLVAITVFIPVSGWVADRFGAKRVFMLAIAVFTCASVLCGRSHVVPVARLLLLRRTPKSEMITVMTWLTMPAMIGPISGPPLGGFLTDHFGWRSVFYINVPIGMLGLILVAWFIPRVPPADPGPADTRGLLLVGLALALLMSGFETIGRGVVPPGLPEALLAAGGLLGALAVRHCLRGVRPAIDFSLLKLPGFFHSAITGSIFRAGAGATPFLVPMLLQLGFHRSATESGIVSFATALGALAMKPLARPILRRFGFRQVLVVNALASAAGIGLCALYTPLWPIPVIFATLALGGLFRSLQFTALNTLAFADVPQARLSAATSFLGTLQQLSPALGVVLATASLEASAAIGGRPELAVADFATAFIVATLVVAASAPWFARLPADSGADVSGHGQR
jgi:MFS family permease